MSLDLIPSVIPGSDGSGRILAIGSSVASTRPDLKPGVDVVRHMVPNFRTITGLGRQNHGTLCRRGIFPSGALLAKPSNLNYAQAATLTCSGLTAWNALMGCEGHEVKKGDWVLVQETGGVSVAAPQIAVAAGANVTATTSSENKAARLRDLGASHVVNYNTMPDWGEKAKALTPEGRGINHVVDIAGQTTMAQSLKAVREYGLVTLAGLAGEFTANNTVDIMGAMFHLCAIRGILLGTHRMLRDMVRFVEERNVQIAVDDVEFKLEDAKSAYERLKLKRHLSKVIITMD